MNENYLTLKDCFMRNSFQPLFFLLLSFGAHAQLDSPCNLVGHQQYLQNNKSIQNPENKFNGSVINVRCYASENDQSPYLYYELNDGTYSINKTAEFVNPRFIDEVNIEKYKVNYRYTGGGKPTHRSTDGNTDSLLKKINASSTSFNNARLSERGLGLEFSNPYYDLFETQNEHVVIVRIPSGCEECKLRVNLNENISNKSNSVLQGMFIRDYFSNKISTEYSDGQVYNINYDEEHLLFIQVKTTRNLRNFDLPDKLNIEAVLSGSQNDNTTMELELYKDGDPKDPNLIEVDKSCITPEALNSTDLLYTVHFQNEGNANAVNVYIAVNLPVGVSTSANGNVINQTNFGRANVSVDTINATTLWYEIINIELQGVGHPKTPNKEATMASFQFKAKTSDYITGNQFGAHANIIFEGKNQINGAPPIEPVRTNDAVVAICNKCDDLRCIEKIKNWLNKLF